MLEYLLLTFLILLLLSAYFLLAKLFAKVSGNKDLDESLKF